MIKFEQSIIINRSPEEVWKHLSNVENLPKWDRGILKRGKRPRGEAV